MEILPENQAEDSLTTNQALPEPVYILDTLEQKLIGAGLVDIQEVIPGIQVDLRYSDTNNFMHQDVYGHLNRAYLQPDVAADLKNARIFCNSKTAI
mgnify:CR=1 FL=1